MEKHPLRSKWAKISIYLKEGHKTKYMRGIWDHAKFLKNGRL